MGHPALPLFLAAESSNRTCDHVVYREPNSSCHVSFRQFFVDHSAGETAECVPAIFFGRGHAHEAELCHLVIDFTRKMIMFVPHLGVWSDLLLGEATDGVANLYLLFVEVEVHWDAPLSYLSAFDAWNNYNSGSTFKILATN